MSKKIIFKKLPTGIVTKQIVNKNATKIIVANSFEEMGKFSTPYYLEDTFVSKYKKTSQMTPSLFIKRGLYFYLKKESI